MTDNDFEIDDYLEEDPERILDEDPESYDSGKYVEAKRSPLGKAYEWLRVNANKAKDKLYDLE